MEYNYSKIEEEIKKFWEEKQVYKVGIDKSKPKYYVLDMFPYPSGAGLHVGHPLGYIGSDIVARYKRMNGFNVLHPMGYDSFGLPAEQYAIQTGQHPAVTAEQNIKRYREQLDKIGFCFDWSREVKTSDPKYYKWTQWIFIQLFKSWYNKETDKAEYIDSLIKAFETKGSNGINAHHSDHHSFTAAEWKSWGERQQQDMLLNYRLAFLADSWVNWCAALGTVLANDEVKDGVSERGGYPVEQRLMKQWSLRITAYSERLLQGLNGLDWSDSIKEAQRNWIGKSEGARVRFAVVSPLQGRGVGGEVWEEDEDQSRPYFTANSDNANFLVGQARANRKNPTEAEELLWEEVRNNKLGVKFRRQHYIGNYIVDFLCLSKMLVIELDGEQHKDNKESDIERTNYLNKEGYTVLRFWNGDVIKKTNEVVKKIEETLSKLPDFKDLKSNTVSSANLTPGPSPEERGTGAGGLEIEVFTTRPDTIFGVTFMVLAPEHELVKQITTPEQKKKVEAYIKKAGAKSERERNADVKNVSGEFTGAYAVHPFTGKDIPIYIADYVLATYGTGAVMAVPCGDSRDFRFAKHFNLPIPNVFEGVDTSNEPYEAKVGKIANSGFLNGLEVPAAMKKAIEEIEKKGIGEGKINYRQRDAIFGRQRYWGEPIPIYYKEGIALPMDENDLPLVLPEIDKYLPTETGDPPLARAKNWRYSPTQTLPKRGEGLATSKGENSLQNETEGDTNKTTERKSSTFESGGKVLPHGEDLGGAGDGYPLELTTMPGWAGSSWYYLRYMDPHNDKVFAGKEALDYWKDIDFYLGGAEHSTGHLLYFRFWTKFLHDLGYISIDEPARKMVNQGMIQGVSATIFRSSKDTSLFYGLTENGDYQWTSKNDKGGQLESTVSSSYVDIGILNGDEVKLEDFQKSNPEYSNAKFFNDVNTLKLSRAVEKMSKSKYNVVNPDDVIADYGADCFRMYEMFLGPIELSKPWDTKGIDGTSRFLRKLWRMFYEDVTGKWLVTEEAPTPDELKVLHKTIKKVNEDIEKLAFNTSVSAFMVCVNELWTLKCNKRSILEPLISILHPFAPFTTEFLWQKLGHTDSILNASFPVADESLLVENSYEYPVSINGKVRTKLHLPMELQQAEVEKEVLALDIVQKWLEGKTPKKVIYVKGRMINVVV